MSNPAELARAIAEIATDTKDPDTATRLMELVDQLLTEAGLPPAPGERSVLPTRCN
jgi:hypothetical protein